VVLFSEIDIIVLGLIICAG